MTQVVLVAVAAVNIYSDGLEMWNDTKYHGEAAYPYDVFNTIGFAGADVYSDPTLFDRYRMFLKFDTSAIPLNATITSVKLRLNIWAGASYVTDDFNTLIIKQDWSAQDPITEGASANAAYDNCYDGTPESAAFNSADLLDDLPHDSGELDPTWVNKGGNTYYSLIADFDKSNTEPSDSNYIAINGRGEDEWEANQAKLVIEYEIPAVGGQPVFVRAPGWGRF